MKTQIATVGKIEKGLLERLADRVQELYLAAQTAPQADRSRINALYREAYLTHRKQKALINEQNLLLRSI